MIRPTSISSPTTNRFPSPTLFLSATASRRKKMLAREDENGASESLLPSKAASPLRQPSARRARSERNRVEHNDTSAVSQRAARPPSPPPKPPSMRSEEHTSELQSLMRISYAVFCLKKKKQTNT